MITDEPRFDQMPYSHEKNIITWLCVCGATLITKQEHEASMKTRHWINCTRRACFSLFGHAVFIIPNLLLRKSCQKVHVAMRAWSSVSYGWMKNGTPANTRQFLPLSFFVQVYLILCLGVFWNQPDSQARVRLVKIPPVSCIFLHTFIHRSSTVCQEHLMDTTFC